MDEVPATPAKSLLSSISSTCQFNGPLPAPLTLLDAVERALCNNPKTVQMWANVKAQAAAVGTGWSAYLPTPCVRIDVASFKETLLAYRGRNEENDDNLSRRIQSQDHCPDAAAA